MSDEQNLPEDLPELGLPVEESTDEQLESTNSSADTSMEEKEDVFKPVNVVEKEVPFNVLDVVFREHENEVDLDELFRFLITPSVGYETLNKELDDLMDEVDENGPRDVQTWLGVASQGVGMYQRNNIHQPAIDDERKDWDVGVAFKERKLGPSRTAYPVTGGEMLTGFAAMAKATAYTTAGAIIRVPLFASGFWVSIKAPTDGELMDLDRKIAMDRAEFGRMSSGRVFAQSDVILKTHLISLAMRQIVDSTFPDQNADLRHHIKLVDLPHLLTGLALSIYPRSFPLARACVAQPGKCSHIQRGDIQINKLLRYNNNAFTEAQRLHMSHNRSRCSNEDLKKYLEAFSSGGKDVIRPKGSLCFTLRSPSLMDYIEMGTEWVTSLETSVDEAFGANISVRERNDLISAKANANAMRQYSHWLERITYMSAEGEAEATVVDRESIYQSLERLSTDPEIASGFFDGVNDYVNHVTVGIVAIPTWICPKCKSRQPGAGEGKWARLIPIDAASVFFTISSHRVSLARTFVGI